MLPENFATPPDNGGHQGSTGPQFPPVYLQSEGQFVFAGPGDPPVRIYSWVPTGDRILETEKAEVVSGAHEIRLGQAEMEGQAGHADQPRGS